MEKVSENIIKIFQNSLNFYSIFLSFKNIWTFHYYLCDFFKIGYIMLQELIIDISDYSMVKILGVGTYGNINTTNTTKWKNIVF